MTEAFPVQIETCVEAAAARLGRALEFLEWPNGDKDAPCHEINALINLQWSLSALEPEFYFYSEGAIAERGRVDLMASNGDISLAIEAKSFGNINERSDSVSRDLKRLYEFEPAYYQGNDTPILNKWWEKSKECWGLLLITSFRGDAVKDAWIATDITSALAIMQSGYTRKSDRPLADGSGFAALLNAPSIYRFAAPITLSNRWSTTGKGWLLCGAVRLPNQSRAAA